MLIWTDNKTGQRFEVKIEEDEPFYRKQGEGDDLAEKFKDHLEQSMTLDQLAEAQRLAREWKATPAR